MTQGSGSIDDLKNRILSRTSLESLASETVALKKASGRHVGLCPFHAEKTPSFHVFPDRYYCFGCKAKGDIIDFVRQTRGMGFIDALKFLCEKYGVEAPELESSRLSSVERQDESAQIRALLAAHEEFKANLRAPEGASARAYLENRGLTSAQIEEYGFGLTPKEGWGLVKKLRSLGFQERELKAASLGTTSEKTGRLYDFFRDSRVMIPIRDAQGRLVAFGGRTLGDHPAKYINSRETKLFDKSALLFGFDRARQTIRQKQRAFIVEGYMDVLQLWAHGIAETVACMGTALTVRHLNLLKAASTTAYLLFDGDAAGQKASLLALEANLQVPEMKLKVIQLPQGKDPDEFVRERGASGLSQLVEQSVDLLDFAISSRLRGASQVQIPSLVTREFIPWLVRIGDRIQKGMILSRIAEISGLSRETLAAEARMHLRHAAAAPGNLTVTVRASTEEAPTATRQTVQPIDRVDIELLGHIFFGSPGESGFSSARDYVTKEARWDSNWLNFALNMLNHLSKSQRPADQDPAAISNGSPEVSALIEQFRKTPAAWAVADRAAAISRILGDIRVRSLRKTIESLRRQVAVVSRNPETAAECRELLSSIVEMNAELRRLETRSPG